MEHVLEDVHPVLSEVVVFSAFNESNDDSSENAGSEPVAVEESPSAYAQGVPCLQTIIIPEPGIDCCRLCRLQILSISYSNL